MKHVVSSLLLVSLAAITPSLVSCSHKGKSISVFVQTACGVGGDYEKKELVSGETIELSDGERFFFRLSEETPKEEVICTFDTSKVMEAVGFAGADEIAFRTVGVYEDEDFSITFPNGEAFTFKLKSLAREKSSLSCDVSWILSYKDRKPERLLEYWSDSDRNFLNEDDGILPGEKVTLEFFGCTWGNAMVGQPLVLDGRPIGVKRSTMEVEEFVVASEGALRCVSSDVVYSVFNASYLGLDDESNYVFTDRDLSYVELSSLEVGTKVYGSKYDDERIGSLFTFNPAA